MMGLIAPAAYAAEDGLVRHQWEERPFVLEKLCVPVLENARTVERESVGS